MKTKTVALTAATLLATCSFSYGQNEPTGGTGVMASKCSRLVGHMDGNVDFGRHPLAFAMLSWTEGYITGTNMNLPQGVARFDLSSLTSTELWASIYGFCKRNPDQFGIAAVIDTMSKLSRIAAKAEGQDTSEVEKEFQELLE